jgi:hypothetical protein
MKEIYTIELDMNNPPIIETALRKFMGKVFKAAEESNCTGHGLTIIRLEDIPDTLRSGGLHDSNNQTR